MLTLYAVVTLMVAAASALVFAKNSWLTLILIALLVALCSIFFGLTFFRSRREDAEQPIVDPELISAPDRSAEMR